MNKKVLIGLGTLIIGAAVGVIGAKAMGAKDAKMAKAKEEKQVIKDAIVEAKATCTKEEYSEQDEKNDELIMNVQYGVKVIKCAVLPRIAIFAGFVAIGNSAFKLKRFYRNVYDAMAESGVDGLAPYSQYDSKVNALVFIGLATGTFLGLKIDKLIGGR